MEIRQTWEPDAAEREAILSLVNICNTFDSIHQSYPFEEGTRHFLLYGNSGELYSVLALFFSAADLCECTAFTLPGKRRRGYFSQLFDASLTFLEDKETEEGAGYDLLFVVSPGCGDTVQVLNALLAEYDYSEYIMERNLTAGDCSPSGLTLDFPEAGQTTGQTTRQITATFGGTKAASCRIEISQACAFLYEVEVTEKLRNQGIGTRFLLELFTRLRETGIRSVRLQVTSTNLAAMALYKKTGFRIIETLSYYLY